ncbi:hypothetical protein [Vreelandella populi]|uniref:Uncharacterized protein n=1 Tax=Vreelandella populi TaxID=2498858 RepID=A0A3S0ZBW7_9GAMM|nr:hypothetical protein [Halomonas populi]RUR43373.1 hypothetical protein ELY37_16785 [Halomonas populi]
MKQAKTVAEQLNEAFAYSLRLEGRRGSLTDFEVTRLGTMLGGSKGNRLLVAVCDLLVSEIERDFDKFDIALSDFKAWNSNFDLACSIASTAQFAFNPLAASLLLGQCFQIAPDDLGFHHGFTKIAWFSGDLTLCAQMIDVRTNLGDDAMPLDTKVEKAISVLNDAQVELALYQELIHGVHQKLREYVSFKRDVNISLDIDVDAYEDGSRGIVLQIFSDQDDEHLDQLDDDMTDLISDTDRWGVDLPRIMTILVRDLLPESQLKGGKFA